MTTLIKLRRDTAANWTSANPTLALGETGWETDTRKGKLGDGTTAWSSLLYIAASDPAALTAATSFVGDASGLYNALVVDAASTSFALEGDSTITTTGTLDDYALGAVAVLRWNGASALALSGIANGADGRILIIANVTAAQTLTLKHDVTSAAGNRFYCPGVADLDIGPNSGVVAIYDSTSTKWRVTGSNLATHTAAADPHTGYVLESLYDAAGDLITASAADTPSKLARGADDTFLRATATTIAYEAIPFSLTAVIDGGGSAVTTGIRPVWRASFPCTVTAVYALADTGTTTVVNAGTGIASAEDFCSANITIDPADAWESGTVDQNQAVAAGESVSVEIVTAGTATMVTIQIDFTRP